MNALKKKTPRFLDDPYRKKEEEDYNNLFFSSYFVLYFYLRESLEKELDFIELKYKINMSMSLVN